MVAVEQVGGVEGLEDQGVAASPPLCGPTGGAPDGSPAKPAAANAGHTPGPWRLGAYDMSKVLVDWRDEHGNLAKEALHRNGFAKCVASTGDHSWRPLVQQIADARLIAAAPELFDALLDLVVAVQFELRTSDDLLRHFDLRLIERGLSSLTKARGHE